MYCPPSEVESPGTEAVRTSSNSTEVGFMLTSNFLLKFLVIISRLPCAAYTVRPSAVSLPVAAASDDDLDNARATNTLMRASTNKEITMAEPFSPASLPSAKILLFAFPGLFIFLCPVCLNLRRNPNSVCCMSLSSSPDRVVPPNLVRWISR